MTMAHQKGGSVAQRQGDTGLQHIDNSHVSMPRLTIEHEDGCFKDSLSQNNYSSLTVVILGLHKGRIMWPAEIGEGEKQDAPLCKSPDFLNGFPNLDPDVAADKRFPWDASNYNLGQALPLTLADGSQTQPALGCKDCRFKEWNTDPSGKKPWCSEEWTIPLLYLHEDQWNPALFTVRRSGLKNAKKYISGFATRKTPLFVATTTLSLDAQKRGNVRYATPVFTKLGDTDQEYWHEYSDQFRSAKSYLSEYPMPRTDDEDANPAAPTDNVWEGEVVTPQANTAQAAAQAAQSAGPATAAAAQQAPPAPKPEPEVYNEDMTPAADPTPEPVASTPAQPVAPASAQPTIPTATPEPTPEPATSGAAEYDPEDEPPF